MTHVPLDGGWEYDSRSTAAIGDSGGADSAPSHGSVQRGFVQGSAQGDGSLYETSSFEGAGGERKPSRAHVASASQRGRGEVVRCRPGGSAFEGGVLLSDPTLNGWERGDAHEGRRGVNW